MNWDMPELPREKPCTHCGECCLTATCALGQAIFLIDEDAICPAIEVDENKLYYCGLINNTANYVSGLVGTDQWKIDLLHGVFAKLIGIGIGCTNGERTGKEHKIDKTLLDLVKETIEEKGASL
jgi:hypothetical protein